MANSNKSMTEKDFQQVIRSTYSESTRTMAVSGFLDAKIGHKIRTVAVSSTIDDLKFLDVINTQTGSTTNTQPTVTGLTGCSLGLSVGMYVYGTGIPEDTTILSIDSDDQITLSQNATATGSPSLKFANLLQILRLEYTTASHEVLIDSERIA
jgi:hypothetical protein